MAVFINFGAIVVNNLASSSGIFFGENVQQAWDAPTKTNQALSILGAGCLTINNININSDPDLVDTPTFHTNFNTPLSPTILKVT